MKALVWQGVRSIAVESVPEPVLSDPGDALVSLDLAAICGSDLHVYHGRESGLDPGTTMGHEGVGTIVDLGPEVRGMRRGDRVFSPFTTSCGSCPPCRGGLTSRCDRGDLFGWVSRGRGLQGMQAGLVRVPMAETTLMAIPDGLSADEALLVGDVFSTGWFCAEQGGVAPGTSCAVVGCGPVGLMAIIAARHMGADPLFCIDTVKDRLALGRRFGAEPIDATSGDAADAVRDRTEGRGVRTVLEAVGSPAAMRTALDLVRPGGVISSVGVHTDPHFAFSPGEAYDRNLTFRTGRCPARRYMEPLARLVAAEKLPIAAIISHRLPLAEAARGYEIFDRRLEGCTKVVLIP